MASPLRNKKPADVVLLDDDDSGAEGQGPTDRMMRSSDLGPYLRQPAPLDHDRDENVQMGLQKRRNASQSFNTSFHGSQFPPEDPRRDVGLSAIQEKMQELQKEVAALQRSVHMDSLQSSTKQSSLAQSRSLPGSPGVESRKLNSEPALMRQQSSHGLSPSSPLASSSSARAVIAQKDVPAESPESPSSPHPRENVQSGENDQLPQRTKSDRSLDRSAFSHKQASQVPVDAFSRRTPGQAATSSAGQERSLYETAYVVNLEGRLDASEKAREELRSTVEAQQRLIDELQKERSLFKKHLKEKFAREVEKFQRTLDLRDREYELKYSTATTRVDSLLEEEREKRRRLLKKIQRLRIAKQAVDDMLLHGAEQLLLEPVSGPKDLRSQLIRTRTEKIKKLSDEACRKLILDMCKIMDVYDVAALPTACRKSQDVLDEVMQLSMD